MDYQGLAALVVRLAVAVPAAGPPVVEACPAAGSVLVLVDSGSVGPVAVALADSYFQAAAGLIDFDQVVAETHSVALIENLVTSESSIPRQAGVGSSNCCSPAVVEILQKAAPAAEFQTLGSASSALADSCCPVAGQADSVHFDFVDRAAASRRVAAD